jgi:hypothetical protein
MKDFGGSMKRFMLLFILVLAVAAFGQEGMEVATEEAPMEMAEEMAEEMAADTAAVDTMAMDEMLGTEEAVVEEAPMEDSGDALEAMLADEGTEEVSMTGSNAVGYTVGLMAGYPIGLGSLSDNEATPVFGIVGSTPFGFAAGPFEMGLGFEASYYTFGTQAEGPAILATVNTAVLETTQGPVAVELGVGWYGGGPGATAGATYSYAIPDMPIVIKPYVRSNFVIDLDLADIEGNDGMMMWLNVGLYASYDLGDLF